MVEMVLDPDLQKDSVFVTDLKLSQVRLHNNAEFPWLILVPRRSSVHEFIDLEEEDQMQLMYEIALVSKVMQKIFAPDKLNIGSLGNIVPQLHVHVVARFYKDKAWPNPVWGSGFVKDYFDDQKTSLVAEIKTALSV